MEEPPPRFFNDIFPENHADLSWAPDRMDPNSSYRLAVRVGAYVQLTDDDGCEYCKACNIPKILDRDSTNWNDLLLEFATEIKLGSKPKLRVTYWDNMSRSYREIDSDQKLLHAIDMYWDTRRLSVQCYTPKNYHFCFYTKPYDKKPKRLLKFEGSIEPVACEALSPVTFMEKGKAKKLKVVRSKKE
ncbi:unnamed protein product [Miscanthus lutarioriparius]|uniref:Uncharacterized protein n=1 Tax=Miscanthus lutarioriparius TaxID=422564 RepID=A0A811RQN3_9POAL|nr:unnamed protein product [Miscanthus lutarioriparius]